MAVKIEGASRFDGFRFVGEEIAKLPQSPQLVRWSGVDAEHVAFLAADIAAHGQQAPVLIRRRADGRPELIAGRHRHAAVLKINADPSAFNLSAPVPLLAVFRDYDDEAAIRASFAENTGKPLSVMDLAHTAAQLANLEWEPARIAEVMSTPHHRVSTARVNALRRLISLPRYVANRLHDGTLKESAARAMIRLNLDAEGMKEMARKLEAGELTVAQLTSDANAERRKAGKKIKRSLVEVRNKLEDIGTDKALDVLAWIDAEMNDDGRIEAIFAE